MKSIPMFKMHKNSQNKEFESHFYIIWLLLLFISSLDKMWKFSEFIGITNAEITSIWSNKKANWQPMTTALCSTSMLINITDTRLFSGTIFPREWGREEDQKQRRAHDHLFTNLYTVQKVWKKGRKVPPNNSYCNINPTNNVFISDLFHFSPDLYKKVVLT